MEFAPSIFGNSTRYAILFLTIVCITLLFSNTLALNFTIICMGSENGGNQTVYDYTPDEKAWLFSAIAVGNLIGSLPVTELFTRFGMRKVLIAYGMISGVSTLLSPLAASYGFYWLFALRIIQGFTLTVSYTGIGSATANWATLAGSGMYVSLLSCHLQFAPILTMPTAAAFCISPIGWAGVFYLQGALTLVFFALFYYYYRDTPRVHKSVSAKELNKIEKGKSGCRRKPQKTPYLAICMDLRIIGVWMSWLGGSLAIQVFLQYGPIYLNEVLNYEISSTGLATAIPFFLSFVVKIAAGPFSDSATCISVRMRIIIITVVSTAAIAICFVTLANLPTGAAFVGLCGYTGVIVFSALVNVGMLKCGQLVSRQFFPFVTTILAVINSFRVLVLPPFVSYMVPTNSVEEWSMVFYIIAVIVVVTNAFFCFVCSADSATWTRESQISSAIHPESDIRAPKKF